MNEALDWAGQYVNITPEERNVIIKSKYAFLFHNNRAWAKKSGTFDNGQGFFDGAESTDLIGLFLLSKTQHLGLCIGKFRDDGLAISWLTPRETENAAKKLSQIYSSFGLKLEVKTNLTVVDYLDITLDLNTGLHAPYMKPNDIKNYVHKLSNHPPAVLRNIPKNINDRLCKLSSNEEIFNRAIPPYQEALVRAGYDYKLRFYQTNNTNSSKKNRTRTRKCVYWNPPFSKNVKTNLVAEFLKIIRSFPQSNVLAPMINTNKIKASYKTVPNMARQVSRKNGRVLKSGDAPPPPPTCNCQRSRKPDCPIPDKCTSTNVCYGCKVIREDNHNCETYVGQTSRMVKKRIGEHLGDARRYRPPPAKQTGSRLSQHIGNLFFHNIPHSLNWSIIAQKQPFNPVANFCMLCNVEKVLILYHPELSTLNLRNELYGWCHHKERMLLLNT